MGTCVIQTVAMKTSSGISRLIFWTYFLICIFYGIILSLGYQVNLILAFQTRFQIGLVSSQDLATVNAELSSHGFDLDCDDVRVYIDTTLLLNICECILAFAMCLTCGLLVHGVVMNKQVLTLPALIFLPIDYLARVVFLLVLISTNGLTNPVAVFFIAVTLGVMMFYMFVWISVYNYRQELREAKPYVTLV